jgi:hypothetical protein
MRTAVDRPEETAALRELFLQIAGEYMRQVRNFMFDLRSGEPPRDWAEVCRPLVVTLRRFAERMELRDLIQALDRFSGELDRAALGGSAVITGEAREGLLAAYASLASVAPQAFSLDIEHDRREPIIVQSLLLQVPGVHRLTMEKVFAAGLSSLQVFLRARPEEVAATAGIPAQVAGLIVEMFQEYRRQVQASVADPSRAAERRQLEQLLGELRGQHQAYEVAAAAWTEEAREQRKRLRRLRQETMHKVNVVLARLGEIDRIQELERLPYDRKVERLEAYLVEAAKPPPGSILPALPARVPGEPR